MGLLFASRNEAHKAHLTTGMYSRHVALGDFYGGIIDLADTFAETYAGRYGVIRDINLEYESPGEEVEGSSDAEDATADMPIAPLLRSHMKWIEDNRDRIVPVNDRPMQNIMDEIVSHYLSTLYKLENLL